MSAITTCSQVGTNLEGSQLGEKKKTTNKFLRKKSFQFYCVGKDEDTA